MTTLSVIAGVWRSPTGYPPFYPVGDDGRRSFIDERDHRAGTERGVACQQAESLCPSPALSTRAARGYTGRARIHSFLALSRPSWRSTIFASKVSGLRIEVGEQLLEMVRYLAAHQEGHSARESAVCRNHGGEGPDSTRIGS